MTAEKPCVPTAKAAEMAGSSGHAEIPDSPKRCLCGRRALEIGAAKAGTLPKQGRGDLGCFFHQIKYLLLTSFIVSKSSRPGFVGLRPLAGCTRSSSDGCRPMPSGPVAQWIRHRPTEPGIVGSGPTRII